MRHLYPGTPPIDEAEAWSMLRALATDPPCCGEGALIRARTGWEIKAHVSASAQQLLDLYLPLLCDPPADRPLVVAHLAQSLDGRIALADGRSQWITGEEDLCHTHRLRALVDAVLVGANTVTCDDPRLTVRRCDGRNPVRVVLDPRRRLQGERAIFRDGEAETLVLTASGGPSRLGEAEVIDVAGDDGVMAPAAILAALHARGIRRVLLEGGGVTVSRFLEAELVDRLHLVVAPMLLGDGRNSLRLPLGTDLASIPRPKTRLIPLGCDWLFDCDLRSPG